MNYFVCHCLKKMCDNRAVLTAILSRKIKIYQDKY